MRKHDLKRQNGASLMEVLVAMSISLVVTASMVALMTGSLSNTARIIKMTKLSDDMRSALQMMSRDVRRSSYNANSMFCYANEDCATDGSVTLPGDVVISDSGECFTFLTDRDHDGDSTENSAGGFRRVTEGSVGVLEMWTGDASPNCASAAGSSNWVQITNPNSMDIFDFSVDENLSYTVQILNDGMGNILSQKVRKIRMNMGGRLVIDNNIERRIEDIIAVRNDLLL